MTGGWAHASPIKAVVYAFDMLLGKKGFLGHNLPLFLVALSLPFLLCAKFAERGSVRLGLIWGVSTWLLYAATSTNLSGGCCSIRWLVPLLAPGPPAVATVSRDEPPRRPALAILGCGGLVLGLGTALRGAWFQRLMPFYWIIYLGTTAVWMTVHCTKRVRATDHPVLAVVHSARIGFPARWTADSDGIVPNPDPVAAKNG